jgi:PAS domain S-box-containing protein
LKRRSRFTVHHFLFAVAAILVAAGFHGPFLDSLPRASFVPFVIAILVTAWFGGLAPGFFATILSVGFEAFSGQEFAAEATTASKIALAVIFLILGTLISILGAALRRSRLRSEESEERFRLMADSAPVMIWMSDATKASTWFNRPWLQFTGRSLEQEKGNGWTEGVHADDLERCLRSYETHFDARTPFEMEYRLRRYDGEFRWILDRGTPLFEGDQFHGFIGSCIDISERKEVERDQDETLLSEHLAREEAERTARYKDEFLATLSHELRTSLNAILGWTHLLSLSREPARVSEAVEVIRRNAKAQAELVNDLLEVSQARSGKIRLEYQLVDLAEVVRNAAASARPTASVKGITLHVNIAGGDLAVAGDSHRLQQVVGNLLSNALKFTPGGGTVSLTVTVDEHACHIFVRDTGVGIGPEFLPHVFDPFRQEDSSTTRRQTGLGIGLALVKNLVLLHGGTVLAESEGERRGATFVVTLPRKPRTSAEEATLSPTRSPLPSLEDISVLIVDDESDSRNFLRRILEQNGARVGAACSVRVALEMLNAEPPDVLISDIAMSNQDGINLIRKIRESDGAVRSVPAIAVTALVGEANHQRILSAGFQEYLAKPIDVEELVRLAATLTQGAHSR